MKLIRKLFQFPYAFFFSILSLVALLNNSLAVERSTYIVHMDRAFMPEDFTSHHHWYLSTINCLSPTNLPSSSYDSPSLVYSYNDALHGFSAVLSQDELQSLKQNPGFISAHSDRRVTLDNTQSYGFLSLNPSHGLWPASNYGENTIIGVVDSGVWPESESFKDYGIATKIPAHWKGKCDGGHDFDPSLCNSKLIGARYFDKGVTASTPDVNISTPSARDAMGHGTHTSSTAAGNYATDVSYFGYAKGTARGMAPRARLAVYKVTWPEGQFGSDVLAGMDQAIADGVDVISISMGFDRVPLYEDPVAIASFSAMEKGVVVSSSAGNEGPKFGSLHNSIPWVLTVAASNTGRTFAGTLTLGNGHSIVGWSLFPARALVENFPLIYNKTLSACNSSVSLSRATTGIIICDASKSVNEQIDHVSTAQVYGAIFISSDPKLFEMGSMTCPGVVISPRDAKAVIKYAKTSDIPTATMEFQQTFVGTKPAPTVATYSSRGPS
ncbi:Subtilisin-like protease [Quillaja saponaria]|uniref:Subtilisin-like protease n=1 Tax=Quillaja saponaria TaxID=32244 RepID=A0AAD7VF61_QUISA|nr:Subtilisin-like protease [Quillaja saponaria]